MSEAEEEAALIAANDVQPESGSSKPELQENSSDQLIVDEDKQLTGGKKEVIRDVNLLSANEENRPQKEFGGSAEKCDEKDTEETTITGSKDEKTDSNNAQSVMDKLSGAAKNARWGWDGISSWGSSILNTASTSVHTFADSVGEGFHVVFDSIESTLDAPAPDELATHDIQRKSAKPPPSPPDSPTDEKTSSIGTDTPVTDQPQCMGEDQTVPAESTESTAESTAEGKASGWWGIGGITNVVKKTVKDTTEVFKEQGKTLVSGGKSLVTGGLDVLETIGKKTYDVIAEGDHGLKQTIRKSNEKINLSQLLREAKEQAEKQAEEEAEFAESRKAHFGTQFDEFQGLVQLEALEMLSNQCEGRVQGLLAGLKGQQLEAVKRDLLAIKDAFKLEDLDQEEDEDDEKDHEFDRLISNYVGELGLKTTPERLIQAQERCRKYLMDCQRDLEDNQPREAKEVHERAIQSLAELTARSIEHYHRVGQLILLDKTAPLSSYKTKSTSLVNATRVLCTEVGIFSVKFTQILGKLASTSNDPSSINPMITNVYLEASNSSTYIQDAFLLLLPVMQQCVIEAHQRATPAP